jgi:CheY-like chemotaxis protein
MSSSSRRILVVDDEEILRAMIRDVLALEGFEVETAASGEEALERLQTPGAFALVITDNNMPGLQGLEVLAKLRQSAPDLPVIIMTAYGSIDVSMRAHELGASGYLLKPFDDIEVIVQEVRRVLARAERARGVES